MCEHICGRTMPAHRKHVSMLLVLSWIGFVEPFNQRNVCRNCNRHFSSSRSAPSLPLRSRKRKEDLDSMLSGETKNYRMAFSTNHFSSD